MLKNKYVLQLIVYKNISNLGDYILRRLNILLKKRRTNPLPFLYFITTKQTLI